MTPTVRYNPRDDEWFFGTDQRRYDGAYSLVIKRQDLAEATATDLARALRTARQHDDETEAVLIDLAPDNEYSPKESVVDPISFVLADDGTLAVRLSFSGEQYFNDDQLRALVGPLTEPFLRRHNGRLTDIRADGHHSTAPYIHEAQLALPTGSKTLLQLYELADSFNRLVEAASTGRLTRDTVADLVIGGRTDLLIGLPENSWIDVKSQHYDLGTPHGAISTAEAVSRFCNAEEGGIVVVGMDTKHRPGGEIIKSLRPVPLDTSTARRYRQAIQTRLFPFPAGLHIQTVETSPSEGVVLISIPPQEEELKPFLVHGAIIEGKVQGAYISIVRRSGEDSIPITAQQIHSTLAAGRALLRRGQLPTRPSGTQPE